MKRKARIIWVSDTRQEAIRMSTKRKTETEEWQNKYEKGSHNKRNGGKNEKNKEKDKNWEKEHMINKSENKRKFEKIKGENPRKGNQEWKGKEKKIAWNGKIKAKEREAAMYIQRGWRSSYTKRRIKKGMATTEENNKET